MNTRDTTDDAQASLGFKLDTTGKAVLRYGLAVVLIYVGLLKFTLYEAQNIEGLVANSPLMAWAYHLLGLRNLSNLLGVVEIALGAMIALRCWSPMICALGSLGAVVMFLITLTFLLSTPGVWQEGYGFPFLSAMPGQFIAKDVIAIGAALWSAGEALLAASPQRVVVSEHGALHRPA